MHSESSAIPVDVVRAEASRFRYPLLLLHGLWTGGWIWRDFSAHLAHRGWDAWIPSFLAAEEPLELEDRRQALAAVCRELPAPPVVVTHDAGLRLADILAAELALPAVVAIAPVVPGRAFLRSRLRWWRSVFLGGPHRLVPPRVGAADPLIAGLSDAEVRCLRTDSGALVQGGTLREGGPDERALPRLIVAADGDSAAPLALCRRLATERGWDLETQAALGHFPMLGASAARLADGVHRWLVRALGADLLAWLDDEDPMNEAP